MACCLRCHDVLVVQDSVHTHDVILCVVSRFFVRGAGHREAQGAQMLYAARVYLVSPSRTTGIEVHAMWFGCVCDLMRSRENETVCEWVDT